MAYLMPDFDGSDGTSYFRNEILRLQELCAENFAKIDALKKENKKLQELHTELKETTSDLAYSLAECPWWEKESLQAAVKILAGFAQKIQYILELPTFIDPVEQLRRNCGLESSEVSTKGMKLVSSKSPGSSPSPYIRSCARCHKKFIRVSSYELHKHLHPSKPRRLKCKICREKFSTFGALRVHLNTFHTFMPSKTTEETYSSLREILQRNHVRVWRFFKCQACDLACSSIGALRRHFLSCRSKGSNGSQKSEDQPGKKDKKDGGRTLVEAPKQCVSVFQDLRHEDTSEDEKETPRGDDASENTGVKTQQNPTEIPAVEETAEHLMTVAQAPVRLAAMHSFSISSPTSKSVEAEEDEIYADLPAASAYYFSSSSTSVDSDVETSVVQESETGEILMKFVCNHHQCSKSFSTRAKLAHHRKSHGKRNDVLLSCQVCGKEFHDKYRLKTHWLSHCPRGFTPKPMYRCLECGKFHRNLNDLADHSKKAHSVSKLPRPLYSCSSCGFRTNFRRKFDVHLKQKCKNRHNNFALSSGARATTVIPAGLNSIFRGQAFKAVPQLSQQQHQQPSTSFRKN